MRNLINIKVSDVGSLSKRDEEDIKYILNNSKDVTIFHTLEWNRLLIKEFGVDCKVLIANKENNSVGCYIFQLKSKHSIFKELYSPNNDYESIYGGPVALNGFNSVKTNLIEASEKLNENITNYLIYPPPNYPIELFRNFHYLHRKEYETPIISLQESEEEIWHRMLYSARKAIKKARRNGLKVVEGEVEHSKYLHDMIKEVYKHSNKNPLPLSFYRRVISELSSRGMAKLFVVKQSEEILGARLVLCFKNTVYDWVGASYFRNRELRPNDLLIWEIIRWAQNKGYKYYDLLRMSIYEDGIRRFKMKFGGDIYSLYRLYKRTKLGQFINFIEFICSPRRIKNKLLNQGRISSK